MQLGRRNMLFAMVCVLSGIAVEPRAQDGPTSLTGHFGWVSAVAFTPDNQMLASASADRTVKLWQVSSGQIKARFRGHTDYVSALAIAPNGKILATGSYDQTARLWDVATGKERAVLSGHRGVVTGVAFAPSG